MNDRKNSRIYVFSIPRTGSNLLTRLFQSHPDIKEIIYALKLPSMFGPDRVDGSLADNIHSAELAEKLIPKYRDKSFDYMRRQMEQEAKDAEADGKVTLFKDHTFYLTRPDIVERIMSGAAEGLSPISHQSNPTLHHDEFLESVTPIFTIRHPLRMVASYYRVGSKIFGVTVDDPSWAVVTSYRWSRMIFNWYRERGVDPLVIDAADLINQAEAIAGQICSKVGIDPGGVKYSWDVGVRNPFHDLPDEFAPLHAVAIGTLMWSSRVERDLALLQDPDLEETTKLWTQTYGEKIAQAMVSAADRAMEDYRYLKGFRLKP